MNEVQIADAILVSRNLARWEKKLAIVQLSQLEMSDA